MAKTIKPVLASLGCLILIALVAFCWFVYALNKDLRDARTQRNVDAAIKEGMKGK